MKASEDRKCSKASRNSPNLMLTNLETSLEQLRAERKPLAALFEKNPQRLLLAIRIKNIDDQIAECSQAIRRAAQ